MSDAASLPQFNPPNGGGRLLLHVPLTPAAALKGAPVDRKDKGRPSLAAGTLVKGTVVAKQVLSLELQLPQGLLGQLHITQVQEGACASNPLERFAIGDSVEAVCIGHVGKPGIQGRRKAELSVRPSLLALAAEGRSVTKPAKATASLRSLKRGATVHGFVEEVTKTFAWVTLAPGTRARLHSLDAPVEDIAAAFSDRFHIGQPLTCRVLKVDKAKRAVDLSYGSAAGTLADAKAAQHHIVSITSVSGQGVRVEVPGLGVGTAALTELHDGWVPDALAGFTEGQGTKAVCLPAVKLAGRRRAQLHLSLKPSLCKASAAAPADKPVTEGNLQEGQQVQGYVKSSGRAGVFVVLSRLLDARIRLSNLADSFVADPEASFPPGKHVKGWVVSMEPGKVEVSLKQPRAGWHNLDPALGPGSTVRGRVKTVESFGVFVQLLEASVTGMAHVSELADDFVKAPADLFKPGQGVRAKVLKLDRQQQRLSLGLKPSYFEGDEDDADLADAAEVSGDDLDLDADMAELSDAELSGDDALSDEASESGSEASEPGSDSSAGADEEAAPAVVQGVGWGDEAEPEALPSLPQAAAGEAAAEGNGDAPEQQLTKRRRQKLQRREEEATRMAQQARLEASVPGDFVALEAAIAAEPNSSFAWIRAMACHVSAGQLAAARALAQRALDTIHFREEAEKRNVWVAWLNLESEYGEPPDEAVMKLFHRALPYNDPKKLYFALLEVLQKAKLEEVLQETLKAVTRRFSGSCKAWLAQIRLHIARKELEAAQKALERALSALPQRKHIKVLSQTALLHFKEGSQEQGRNLLESILRNFPKRLDLWNLYIDQEVKLGEAARVRALFSRATHAELPVKKMRAVFKRFLEYEQAYGDAQSVTAVQAAAQAYVDEHIPQ